MTIGTNWGVPIQNRHVGYVAQNRMPSSEFLRIAAFNDIHEKFSAYSRIITAFKHLARQAQQDGLDLLKLSAGDWNAGKETNELELGARLANMTDIPLTAMGNHELDAGSKAYAEALNKTKFKTLVTNLVVPQQSKLSQRILDGKLFQGPVIMTSPNGVKYGFVGFTSPDIEKYLNADAKLEGVTTLPFTDGLKHLQKNVDELKRQGINRIIALTHCDDEEDIQIAQHTSGIDLIIGGHSHKQNRHFLKSASGEPVTILKTKGNGMEFAVLDSYWTAEGFAYPLQALFYKPKDFPEDSEATSLIDTMLKPAKAIGKMGADVNTESAASSGENEVANKVADTIKMATDADIALFRGTELRNDIYKGNFTDRDLKSLLPFSDNLAMFKMSGKEILEVLNESAKSLKHETNHPGIMHASGLQYTVNKNLGKTIQASVFNRSTQRWEMLDPQKTYTVATGGYVLKSKDDYPVFKKVPLLRQFSFCLRDAFGNYIQSQKGQPVFFAQDGRLKVVENNVQKNNKSSIGFAQNSMPFYTQYQYPVLPSYLNF